MWNKDTVRKHFQNLVSKLANANTEIYKRDLCVGQKLPLAC